MRIAIVGPTHPYKGGIAQHTTELANRLRAAGHEVIVFSWKTQYPFFYPGAQFVPENKPELTPFPNTKRSLSWKNPAGWWRTGSQLKGYDHVILIWWVPTIQGPVYLNMLRAMGRHRPPVTVICHNVLPHEPRLGDRVLGRAVLCRVDRVITHSRAQASIARDLTNGEVIVAGLPLTLQISKQASNNKTVKTIHRLLFFGLVRPYKGLDVLLRALADLKDVHLHIAGEFWGGQNSYRQLINDLKLNDRVTIDESYVSADDLENLFRSTDALVLPYKHGSATWNVSLAHAYGLPVIATTAGSMAAQVNDGTDGLLCKPDNVHSLKTAINRFYEPGIAKHLHAGVVKPDIDGQWRDYISAVTED